MPLRFLPYNDQILIIPGNSGVVVPESLMTPATRRHHYGTYGESEIRSFRGGRRLNCNHWLHEYGIRTYESLMGLIRKIDEALNKHGVLEEIAANNKILNRFENTTFVSSSRAREMAPLKDFGNCLGPGQRYWIELDFVFYQTFDGDRV